MTICLAAISEGGGIIGMSDRMLSMSDTEFETGQSKIWQFSDSVSALIAGNMEVQSELLRLVDNEVKERLRSGQVMWVSVREVVQLYCQKYREHRRAMAEAELLFPLGLDLASFVQGSLSGNADAQAKITNELLDYRFPEERHSEMEAIFIGVDEDGPILADGKSGAYSKIYVVQGDSVSNRTNVGFATIGIGKPHADSHFMVSGYWPKVPFLESILISYSAKKRAESAPGVGKMTDMILIGPLKGQNSKMLDSELERLDKIYGKSQEPTKRAFKTATKRLEKLIQEIISERSEKHGTEKAPDEVSQPQNENQ
jgi:hypothetical protein